MSHALRKKERISTTTLSLITPNKCHPHFLDLTLIAKSFKGNSHPSLI
jgi:hypothetical protein